MLNGPTLLLSVSTGWVRTEDVLGRVNLGLGSITLDLFGLALVFLLTLDY